MEGDVVGFSDPTSSNIKTTSEARYAIFGEQKPIGSCIGRAVESIPVLRGKSRVNRVYPIEFSMVIACVEFMDRKRYSMISKPAMNVSAMK
jgi:hypothetical protein